MNNPTIFMDIYEYLSDNGIDVYSPEQKLGECTSPYVVVKNAGTSRYGQYSSTRTLYYVMCYVPGDQYTKLEQYIEKVKEVLKGLYPMLRPTFSETPSYYDDSVKAHMVSIEYVVYRKLIGKGGK